MVRINSLEMSVQDVVSKLAGGNPGAVVVCSAILKEGEGIDPDGLLGGLGLVLMLDTFGIYEDKIWMLHKDVCGQDLQKTIGLLRSCQMGLLPESALRDAIDNRGRGIDVDELIDRLREILPNFGRVAPLLPE